MSTTPISVEVGHPVRDLDSMKGAIIETLGGLDHYRLSAKIQWDDSSASIERVACSQLRWVGDCWQIY